MSIIGYFANLDEAQKLVQDKKLAGVIQQIFEEGQLLGKLPVTQIDSKLLTYIRQKTRPSPAQYGIGAEIPWSSSVEFEDEVKVGLTRSAYAAPLDNFMLTAYKDPNDYRTQILKGITEGCMAYIEDLIIYGDGGTDNPTGLDKLCPATGGHTFASYQDLDMGGAGATGELTITALLDCIDACKPKPNVLVMTRALRNQITLFTMTKSGAIVYASDIDKDFGRRIEYINSIPVIVSDYLATENDNTGGKLGTGNLVSLYAIRFGSIEDGGLSLVAGGGTGGNMLFKVKTLGELEGYDAEGIRLTAYWNLALGSTKAISRIHSIDQTQAITVAGS